MSRSYATALEMNMPFHGAKLALLTIGHVVALLRDDDPEIDHPGCWDLPGGGREGAEDALDCALRETREELGLVLRRRDVIWGRRLERQGCGFWFFAARVEVEVLRDIRFGNEGQGWAAMTHGQFLRHPKVIAHFKDRLRLCIDELS